MKYQVGLALEPADNDESFDDEQAAIEYAWQLHLKHGYETPIAVWEGGMHAWLFFMTDQWRIA